MLDNVNKYLEATNQFLGISDSRYGGGFFAIVCHQSNVDWLVNQLNGDDFQGTQTLLFFAESPAFPACCGGTASEALEKLDQKLGLLYDFISTSDKVYQWECRPKFPMKAQYDSEPGEAVEYYEVNWDMIIEDLDSSFRKTETYFYEDAKDKASLTTYRNLHALINLKLPDDIVAKLGE